VAGEVESATQRHITANARQPGSADILRALAEDYAEAGRVDECIRALDDLLAVSPNDKHALSKKRDVLEDARNFDRAIEAHQALLKTGAPDCGKLIALRLKASQEAEAPEQARSHLEAALRHNKKCAAAHRLFGETFFREDNIAGATKAWSSGWKATKDLSLLQRLCEVYVASGQGKKAFKLCRHAKEASPDEPLPALLYAITAYKIEDYQAAESTLAYQPLASNPTAALLRLELSRKLGDPETVSNQIKETLSALQHLSKPYECSDCGDSLDEWTPQCPSCKSWDTIRLTSLLNLDIPIDLEAEAPGNEAAADRTSTS
jgi:lipopolysaccharide biosynthesis regulator YciM